MFILALLLACDDGLKEPGPVPDPDEPWIGPDDTARDTDSRADSGGSDSGGGDTAPQEEVVRFVALGDAGEGNDVQFRVGQTIADVCAVQGCDFALYLGDNFYDSGVDGLDDAQFDAKFEDPYAPIDFPFYIALGNHDYGGGGLGWELSKGQTYVDYSNRSAKWTFPDLFYSHTHGHATFFALDTTQLFWTIDEEQRDWLPQAVAQTNATWRIAYGHHPYTSNGPHGDAGNYDGTTNVPFWSGNTIRDFMEDEVCGTMDVYLCGHDHSLQWPEARCGTEFLVSGAGAKTTDLPGTDPAWFEQATPGFLWVELRGRTFTGVFYDQTGLELYRRSFTK
ncbi:MAG: hypothetical protein RLZZ299_77 [Pseudomonadota bacterium]